MTTSLYLGGRDGSRVLLPVVPHQKRPSPSFLVPEEDPELAGYESLDEGTTSGYGEISSVDRNPQTGEVRVTATNDWGMRYPWGTERSRETIIHKTSDDHPENTSVRGEHRLEVELEERTLIWEAELLFRSDLESLYYTYTRRLLENGVLLREKTWRDTISRDYQ
jgi:hypothetical protein